MSKTLDFNKLKKKYFTVTLPDENNTVLMIKTPTKEIMDDFIYMKDSLSPEAMGDDAIDELYELCAKIMTQNKGGIKISAEDLSKCLDFEDIVIFIKSYTEFINEASSSKN